ncbi:MAG: hypothetical protein HRF49_07205 [bacterium]
MNVSSEIAALEKPEGVSDSTWNLLVGELTRQLDGRRAVSAAPKGAGNAPELYLFDPGDGSLDFEWDYFSSGDYDRNGEVGVSDITPIALNYLADADDGVGDDVLENFIDGDDNGEIGVSDITPIALNFLATVEGYIIESSDSEAGPFTEVTRLNFADGDDSAIPHFVYTMATPPSTATYFRVVSFHGTDTGEPSNVVAFTPGITYNTDTTLPSLVIEDGFRVNLTNDARLHVTGDATIDGELRGVDGNLYFEVDGNLTVNGDITLDSPPGSQPEGDPFDSIFLVVHGDVTFSDTSTVTSDGSIFVATNEADIPTPDEADADCDMDDGTSPTIAPFDQSGPLPYVSARPYIPQAVRSASQAANPLTFRGTWTVRTPPRGTRRIVVAIWPAGTDVQIEQFTLNCPNGNDGLDDLSGNPVATGGHGERALNLNINVVDGSLTFNGDVTINLGSGGRGGNAMAIGDKDASATGGDGGQPAKLKIRGTNGIFVAGTLTINPGAGGDGGYAEAHGADGADGCPAEDGGNAVAYGGYGATVNRVLTYRGTTGIENVVFGAQSGGDGGYAIATGGFGGNDTCIPGGVGGRGGDATAIGGNGGDSFIDVTGASGGGGIGGDGGNAYCAEGYGGHGNSFADKTPGGDGGNGGNMVSDAGRGGAGTSSEGTAGTPEIDASAGWGGDGGNGCPPGVHGTGGSWEYFIDGNPTGTGRGNDGADGASTCFFWFFPWTWILADGNITPGTYTEDIFNDADPPAQVGTMPVEFLDIPGAEYFTQSDPVRHVGFSGPGILRVNVGSILLNEGAPGDIIGISFQPIQPFFTVGEDWPLLIQAYDSSDNLLDTVTITDPNLTTVDSFFDVFTEISYIDIVPFEGCFITLDSLFIWDP